MIPLNLKLGTMSLYGMDDTLHALIMDNTSEVWRTSSANNCNDGVSVPPLHIFMILLIFS